VKGADQRKENEYDADAAQERLKLEVANNEEEAPGQKERKIRWERKDEKKKRKRKKKGKMRREKKGKEKKQTTNQSERTNSAANERRDPRLVLFFFLFPCFVIFFYPIIQYGSLASSQFLLFFFFFLPFSLTLFFSAWNFHWCWAAVLGLVLLPVKAKSGFLSHHHHS